MGNLLVGVFELLGRFKVVFLLLVALVFGGALLTITKINFEEDITKMMPANEKTKEFNRVFKSARFLDKLVLTVSLADTSETNPDKLIDFTNTMVDSLELISKDLITEINYRFSDNQIQEVYNQFYEQLPLYLDSVDYDQLAKKTDSISIKQTVSKNYKTLLSPVSGPLKKFIIKDPLSIVPIVLKKLETLNLDSNYELHDGYILTKDKKHLIIFIVPTQPNNETMKNASLLAKLDTLMDATSKQFKNEVSAEYYGAMAVAVGNARRIENDIKLTVSIATICLIIFIGLFYRKPLVFVYILLPVAFGGAMGLGALYFGFDSISTVALAVGSVLLGITLDFSLHTITHARTVSDSKRLLKDLATPIITSCLTTASAFMCLKFVRAEALNQLGLFAAISVFSAAMFCLLVLPHLLGKGFFNSSKIITKSTPNFLEKLANIPFHKNKYWLLIVAVITVTCLFTFKNVGIEKDMLSMNYLSPKLKQAEENINKINSYTLKSVYVVAKGNNLNDALFNSSKNKQAVEKLIDSGLVKNYSSVNTLVFSEEEQNAKIARWNSFWSQERKQKVKQTLLTEGAKFKFKEKAFRSFFNLLDVDFVPVLPDSLVKQHARIVGQFITNGVNEATVTSQLKVHPSNLTEVYSALDKLDNTVVIDKQYITNNLVATLQNDFSSLINISLLVVFIILFLSFGRIELALITFLPMLISWLWTLGIMGILGLQFNIFNIIISTFIFGLGIDYSIFITRGLVQEYKTGKKHISSYKTSILLSMVTTIVGIGVLIFAEHPALKSIAALSIIGILASVLVSFTIQPILFRWFVTSRVKKGNVPMLFTDFVGSIGMFLVFLLGALVLTVLGLIFLIPPRSRNRRRKYFYHLVLMYASKLAIYLPVYVKKKIINLTPETFAKPSVIIANHQSHIDIPLILMLHPKIVVLVNDWVYNNPYYGAVVKMADFYPVSGGFDGGLDRMKEMVADGYSVLVFPEGSRQKDCKITRFHKGAFLLAQELQLPILPVILHGVGHVMTKGDNFVKTGQLTVKILPKIPLNDQRFGQTSRRKAKEIGQYFRNEFEYLKSEKETAKYWSGTVVKNYIYKSPQAPWYVKVKLGLEDYYNPIMPFIPKQGVVTDIGCGMGYLPLLLAATSKDRTVIGVDYDEDKIEIADNCLSKTENVSFIAGDALTELTTNSDAFILLDILHYLPQAKQKQLIEKCIELLNDKGTIIIRDADASLEKRTKGTKLTEFFSTKIMQFNKAEHELEFVDRNFILEVVKNAGLQVEILDNSKHTSNIIYIIKNVS